MQIRVFFLVPDFAILVNWVDIFLFIYRLEIFSRSENLRFLAKMEHLISQLVHGITYNIIPSMVYINIYGGVHVPV